MRLNCQIPIKYSFIIQIISNLWILIIIINYSIFLIIIINKSRGFIHCSIFQLAHLKYKFLNLTSELGLNQRCTATFKINDNPPPLHTHTHLHTQWELHISVLSLIFWAMLILCQTERRIFNIWSWLGTGTPSWLKNLKLGTLQTHTAMVYSIS